MTPGMQIRLWLRQASKTQVGVTAVALAGVVVLLVASLTTGGHHRASTSVAAGAGAATNTGQGALAPATPEGGTGTAPVAGGTSGAAAVVSAPTTGGAAAVPGAGGTTAATAAGGTTGATGQTAGPLTASDRGVTPTTVKIGFLIANVGGLDQGGFALGLRTDIGQAIDAFVDDANKHGGMAGRKVVAVKRTEDPTNQGDLKAACDYMLRDQQVFGVVDSASNIYAATQRCYTIDNKTPLAHVYALSADFMTAGGGYDMTTTPNLDRIAKFVGAAAKQMGFVKGGEHVGIFTDACEPSNTVIRKVMAPAFKADGAATVDIAQTDCDPQAQTSQVPNAVLQMKTKNVDRMFMATSFVGVQNFLTNADAQQFHPKYFASDYDGMAADLFTKNFPPTQWDRTQGISSGYSGWLRAGHGLTPAQKRCSDILVAHGLPAMKDDAANGEVISQCDAFLNIMVPAAKAAGANLTRAGWAQASQRLGHVDVAGFQACTYAPGKYSCGDSYASVEWRKEFQGYIQISGYRPANA